MVDVAASDHDETVTDGPDEYEIRVDALSLAIDTVEPDLSPETGMVILERAEAFAAWLRDGA
jgi:hypothetical protein